MICASDISKMLSNQYRRLSAAPIDILNDELTGPLFVIGVMIPAFDCPDRVAGLRLITFCGLRLYQVYLVICCDHKPTSQA